MLRPSHRWMHAVATGIVWFGLLLPATAATRVLVVPFAAPTEAIWQDLGAAAADTITDALAQMPDFEVLAWDSLARGSNPPLRRSDETAVLAQARRAGIDVVVTGDLHIQDDQVRLSGKFTQLSDGKVTRATSLTGHLREIFDLEERFTRAFLSERGVVPSAQQSQRIRSHLDATRNLSAVTLYHQGREAYRQGGSANYEKALLRFNQALAADPGYTLSLAAKAETMARLSFIRSHTGKSWAAAAQRARRLAETAVARQPDLSEAHRALAMCQLVLGEPAAESVGRALALAPNDPETLTLQWMVTHDKAHESLVKALKINPWLALAHDGIGLDQLRSGKINEAISAFRKAAKAEPGDGVAHLYLGLALKQNWQLREAAAELRTAISLDPLAPMAHYHLGRVLQAQGLFDEAYQAFQAALNAAPHMEEARQAMNKLRRQIEGNSNDRPQRNGSS